MNEVVPYLSSMPTGTSVTLPLPPWVRVLRYIGWSRLMEGDVWPVVGNATSYPMSAYGRSVLLYALPSSRFMLPRMPTRLVFYTPYTVTTVEVPASLRFPLNDTTGVTLETFGKDSISAMSVSVNMCEPLGIM